MPQELENYVPGAVSSIVNKKRKRNINEKVDTLFKTHLPRIKKEKKSFENSDNSSFKVESDNVKQKKSDNCNERTIFVGNLPFDTTQKELKKLFSRYGQIDSVRFRSAVSADKKLPKKAAIIKKQLHPKKDNINAYIVFSDKESTDKALEMNSCMLKDHHLRVDLCNQLKPKHDVNNSIFIGNLPFDAQEEQVREIFKKFGVILNVRIVRDKLTGLGKGIGYVQFRSRDEVMLSLTMDGKTNLGRNLRIQHCSVNKNKKENSHGFQGLTTKKKRKKSFSFDTAFKRHGERSQNKHAAMERISNKSTKSTATKPKRHASKKRKNKKTSTVKRK